MAKRVLTPFNFVNLTSDPDTAASGDIYYNSDSDTIRYYDGEAWNDVGTGAGGGITVSETAPSNPSLGDAWFKNTANELYIYDGTFWVQTNSIIENNQLFTVGSTPPSSPSTGAGWFNESTNSFYIYDGTYWIEVAKTTSLYLVDDPDPTLGANMSASGYGIGDIGYLDFDTNTLAESIESRLRWDSDFGTLSIGMEGGDVELPIGQKQGAYVKNTSGVNIGKGKAVQFSGAQGGKIEVEKAISDGTVPSKYMFGITAEAIDDDEFGFVVTEGYIRGIDTSGLEVGDFLYFDPNTPGNLTAVEPPTTAFNIPIAAVTFVNASAGVIYVRMNMEYELKEIEDIQLISPQDGDVLVYNIASALWNNAPTVSSLIGTTNQVDVSASTGAITASLANSGVSASTYGSASEIPILVVDEKGRITSASVAGIEGLPNQTGQSGKYLTTNGTVASWGVVDLSTKANINSPTFTGVPAAPTAAAGTNTTQLATTAFVTTADNLKANLASPTFTGVPAAPTAAADTNTTQLATTAFVVGQVGTANPVMNGTVAVGTSLRYARQDHVHASDTSRAPLASPTFTGVPAAPTAAAGTNTTQLATTAFVTTAGNLKANLASPTFTGVPAAPTAAAGTNTTQLATTAFVTTAGNLKANLAGATFTGQIISTMANNTGTGLGQIYLNGATGNRIDFNANGVAAPAFTTRSAGTKVVLYPGIAASSADYALGIENSTMWLSVPTTSTQFKFYAGTTNIATFAGTAATFNTTVTGVSPTAAGSIGFRRTTMSTASPSGGLDGDVWLRYS